MLCPLTGLDIMPRQFMSFKKIDCQGLQYFLDYKTEVFFHSKQTQKSRSILENGSSSLGLFRKGTILIIAFLHRTDLINWSHSHRRENPII